MHVTHLSSLTDIKKIHLVAVCGTAMGTLAGILKTQGYQVSGSDKNMYPPMSLELEKRGIVVFNEYHPNHIKQAQPDLVIIGNAVRKDNAEAVYVIEQGIPYMSMTEALSHYLIAVKESVVVAGTHGKTTTTSLLAHMLYECGQDPSLFVGGVALNFQSSFRLGQGPYVVIEGDEYDTAFFDKTPKFWHYKPKHAIITHLEFDHADIYKDIQEVEAAFKKFITLIPVDGSLLVCSHVEKLMALVPFASCPVSTYEVQTDYKQVAPKARHWLAHDLELLEDSSRFLVTYWNEQNQKTSYGIFEIPLSGTHNIQNALACIALSIQLGCPVESIKKSLLLFLNVKRRMEVRAVASGITLVDDFAHHPTAVTATLCAAKQKFPHARIIAIFEPRSQTSRRQIFQDAYIQAFQHADIAIIADAFGNLEPHERFNSSYVCKSLQKNGIQAYALADNQDIINYLSQHSQKGDVILVMSNGGFGGLIDQIKTQILT